MQKVMLLCIICGVVLGYGLEYDEEIEDSYNTSFAISFEKGRRLMSYKIADEINSILDKNIVLYVYFKDFIIK